MNRKRSSVPQMRGVSAFLSNPADTIPDSAEQKTASSVAIEKIRLSVQQPRRFFDPDKLESLAASIRQHGILEPVLVRSLPEGEYELVAGERRYRAAQLARLQEIPIVARDLSDQEALQLALIENLQREDLNPVEETEGMLDLLTLKLGCSQEAIFDALAQMATTQKKGIELSGNVSRRVKKIAEVLESTIGLTPESFRTSRLPLLKLPADVLAALRQGKLEYTKARAVSRLKDDKSRQRLLQEVIAKDLSLSQIKARLKELAPVTRNEPTVSDRLISVARELRERKGLDNPKKQRRLEKLLQDLESLLEDEG